MNWDIIEGNWQQFRGRVKEQWGKLTDDDLDRIEGRRDRLLGRIQAAYGITKDEAESRLSDWENESQDQDDVTTVRRGKVPISTRALPR